MCNSSELRLFHTAVSIPNARHISFVALSVTSQVKLDALKAETKFTESCQIVKLSGSHAIHSGMLRISDIRRTQMVATIHLYCNNKPANDVSELKNKWDVWRRVKTLQVPPAQAEIRFDFTIPVVATNILIEYASFHDTGSAGGASEKLQCPRCSRTVTDRHGICKHCGDNAYQCRHCRNINYEKLDAFLCNECGFCKHARFDYTLVVKPSYVVERITNEDERERLLALMDAELANVTKRHGQLAAVKRPLERLLGQPADAILQLLQLGDKSSVGCATSAGGTSSGIGGGGVTLDSSEALLALLPGTAPLRIQRKITILAMLYSKEAKKAHDSLSKSTQVLQAARTELLRYLQLNAAGPQPKLGSNAGGGHGRAESSLPLTSPTAVNSRYDCAAAYVLHCLSLLESICAASARSSSARTSVRTHLIDLGLADLLVDSFSANVPPKVQSVATRLTCLLCQGSSKATSSVLAILTSRIELQLANHTQLPHDGLLQAEIHLLTELAVIDDELWPVRLQTLLRILFRGTTHLSSPLICDRLTLPVLRAVARLITSSAAVPPSADAARSSAALSVPSLRSAHPLSTPEGIPSLLPASIRAAAADVAATRESIASRLSAPPRRLIGGSVRSLLSSTDACGSSLDETRSSAAATAASRSVVSCAGEVTGMAGSHSGPTGAARLCESGATVRFDQFLVAPQATFEAWERKVGTPHIDTADCEAPLGLSPALHACVLRCGRRWHARACVVPLPRSVGKDTWLCRLLLCPASHGVRDEAAALLTALAEVPSLTEGPAGRAIRFLDLIIELLPAAVCAPRCADAYFELLQHLMRPESRRLYLVARGLLGTLCGLIGAEARRLRQQEDSAMVDMAQGAMLKTLVELLHSFVSLPTVSARFRREERLPTLLHALLCVRGLVMQKTSVTQECATRLQPLLTALHEGSEPDRRRFMAACVASLREHADMAGSVDASGIGGRSSDGRSLIFLFEQLCSLVCPEKPEPEYMLMLNKTVTQEEFIRGSMVKNPYSSKSVGPLMRDVKNKICRDLDLGGLIEDDNGMELLVAGKIVKLHLTVAATYEQVWLPHLVAQGSADGATTSPMVVVYRLQGLDGEATEPIVESLSEECGEERDPEAEYAIAAVVGETGGLEVMMDILSRSTPLLRVRECAALLLKLLQHCCKIRANRTAMLAMGGTQQLLRLLPEALADEALAVVAERMALTIESLLDEELTARLGNDMESALSTSAPMQVECAYVVPEAAPVSAEGDVEWSTYLGALLTGLSSESVREQKQVVRALVRLLPLVTRGEAPLISQLLGTLSPYADFDAYDERGHMDEAQTYGVECLVATLSSLRPGTPLARRVKKAALEASIASTAAAYLLAHLPPNMDAGSQLWLASLGRPALPYALQLLGGLAKGDDAVQSVLLTAGIDEDIGRSGSSTSSPLMTRLHALERQSSSASKAIGTLAESLLEALRERAAADVDRLRRETTESKRKAALDKRQRMLKKMGMAVSPDSGGVGKVIVSQHVSPSLMEDLEDEQGHVCVVCGEGETYRPGEVLGCYAFCKRVPLLLQAGGPSPHISPGAAVGGGGLTETCYTSVSHFNIIHFSCHRDATRAERSLKQPKEEWEGATLRNSQTKCNNLLPLQGATVTDEAYAICVEQW